ncbi:MAG: hypothetical protein KF847_18320 [Pirellulales bacterium]|nr:hypothetical protein [Pirellulales bacterium]
MAKQKPTLLDVSNQIYSLLEPLESPERRRIIDSVFTLLGEENSRMPVSGDRKAKERGAIEDGELPIGPKARRWMSQNDITETMLEEIFHFSNGNAEVFAADVPGTSKMSRSRSCYLLAGTQSFLATDEPTFQDSAGVAICKRMGCYNGPNNAKMRSDMGLGGSKQAGWTLTAPCLREAAQLIKSMVPGNES